MISEETKHRMMHFAINHLEKKQLRDDYLKLLELFLLVGEIPPRGPKFCVFGTCAPRTLAEQTSLCFKNMYVSKAV